MSPMFVPGPVDVDPAILAAQTRQMLPHRSLEFEEIYRRSWEKAQKIFQTRSKVFIVTASGTGLQEAAVRNFARRFVLSCVNGAFSQRWYEVALCNGKQADLLESEWGKSISPERVADALRQKPYEMITVVHNETSTGVENPIKEIAKVVREISPETLICVDAVSSLGGVNIETDAWELDFVLTSSQKCLALPPGLALAAVSERALSYAQSVPERGWYFDFIRLDNHLLKDSTPATPAISLIYSLDVQLDRILEEGLEARFARHRAMAKRTQSWAVSSGFSLFAEENAGSNTVTTVNNNRYIDLSDLNSFLLKRGMRIANGYGPLKGKTFRIAHMGETTMDDLEALFHAFDDYLAVRDQS